MHTGQKSSGESSQEIVNDISELLLFDSGATHHIVHQNTSEASLRKVRSSEVDCITLGGGEKHDVHGEGDLLLYSTIQCSKLLLTNAWHIQHICVLCAMH
jgi:hypothetical protein